MLALANYSMKGPMQANIAVTLLSALSVWIAPIGILAGGIIALITLRVNAVEGAKSLIWAMLVQIALTVMLNGSYLPAVIAIMEYFLPVFVMAVVLRKTNSLAQSLHLGMLMIGVALVAFHLMVGDTSAWWLTMFNNQIKPVLDTAGVDFDASFVPQMSQMVTMLLAVFALILWFSILMLGRWWQSQLYYPGQFQQDFHQLALPKSTATIAVVIAITGLIVGQEVRLLYDISGVVIAALMFQGLSIAHFLVRSRDASTAWLVGLYVLLFLLPQMMLILATIGLLDSWMNFRDRGKTQ
ncbi:hypothetical protein THMIRHAS_13540 [Thiosulfatimonas sediminis]|uniref:DUF2232 domain-containing protein n=1 Tax=Thiosulfatimonas sediminis TaxID=2675054 RepID=A0A6F8PV22_9GAMM|nr:DUF2232 domain-containing protein [Thiosulfatimonas sediminis]BBP45981.1 hypothetical protein THMIRHAS_13540 [Thiosulfatimonas sediminis]